MSLSDLLRGISLSFAAHRVRTLLTLLGIMIGTGSIVTLAGLLAGAEEALVKLNQGVNESDTLRIHKDDAPQSLLERAARELSRSDGEALDGSAQLPGVSVTVEAREETVARSGGKEKRVRLVGGDPFSMEMYRLRLSRGRFIDDEDMVNGHRVAVIGHEVYTELLGSNPEVLGTQLRVGDEGWKIVGVLEHKPFTGHGTGTWMWDRRVLVPRVAFDATFSPSHEVHSLFLRVRGPTATEKWMSTLGTIAETILLRRHLGVKNFKLEDRKGSAQERMILTIIQILLLATALMSLFVGGINIMNIMLVTVTERTREIGVRRAVGASPRDILSQFVLEAAAVSSIGGVLGVLGGVLVSWLVGLGLASAFGAWQFHVEVWSIAAGLGLAVATGVAFGFFPAWRASRLNPVEALRYE